MAKGPNSEGGQGKGRWAEFGGEGIHDGGKEAGRKKGIGLGNLGERTRAVNPVGSLPLARLSFLPFAICHLPLFIDFPP